VLTTAILATGAICISEILRKCSLEVLDISDNIIGDDGITAIAETLGNSEIIVLVVKECSFTIAGSRSLAAGLLVNNSVKILDVQDNPINVDGAQLILQAAVDNGVCQEVVVYDEWFGVENYWGNNEMTKLMILLKKRWRQAVGSCVVM